MTRVVTQSGVVNSSKDAYIDQCFTRLLVKRQRLRLDVLEKPKDVSCMQKVNGTQLTRDILANNLKL